MLSGFAAMVSDCARPDGPLSGGASFLCTVQPTSVSVATAAISVEKAFIGLEIPKVAEFDLQGAGNTRLVTGLIVAVEGDLRECRDELITAPQLNQRRFFFRGYSHQLESKRRRGVSVNRDRDGP